MQGPEILYFVGPSQNVTLLRVTIFAHDEISNEVSVCKMKYNMISKMFPTYLNVALKL
jgi:hypothetical protein